MSRLTNKVALVTGGGSGIGLAVARAFLQEGACVAITGRDETKLRRAAEGMDVGGHLLHHAADLSRPEQVSGLFKIVTAQLGPIDILVNNAGTNIKERTFRELTPETWRLLIGANMDAAFYCMREVAPSMAARGGGLIININSIAGLRASPLGGPAYSAAKFGLHALSLCVAAEERAAGIRVCGIYPGEVNTPILDVRPKAVDEAQRQRILQPEDIAAAVLFMATLPPHVVVPELVINPVVQDYR
jgi:NAD(P)-dependent dehydrogenase (short-subunit alcohol dehydrogenase family)